MLFVKTRKYDYAIPYDYLRASLVGNVIRIKDREFKFVEDGISFIVIATDPEANAITSFPFTMVKLYGEGNKTKVVITSKMSKADSGGPIVIFILCLFLVLVSFFLYYITKNVLLLMSLSIVSLCIYGIYLIAMGMTYFYFIRKINEHIKYICDHITTDVRRQLMKHKK